MRVLLTGASGFIGSHIAEALTARGHEVRSLDLPDAGAPPVPVFEHVAGDVRDPATVVQCLTGVDAVCHQAAMVGLGVDIADLPAYSSTNVLGTAVLLAGMAEAGVGRLALASSMVVYGEGAYSCPAHGPARPRPRTVEALRSGRFDPECDLAEGCGRPLRPGTVGEDAPLDPRNVYADTKVAQEHLAASWARTVDGRVAALRYHNVYGPRMPMDTPYAGVAALFRSRLEHGEPPLVYEDGAQRRDFVHVRDVAHANVLALEAPRAPGRLCPYNIASGEPHSVGEMAQALASVYGGPDPVVTGGFRLGDVRHIVASPLRAADELGFTAAIAFAEGMKEFAGR